MKYSGQTTPPAISGAKININTEKFTSFTYT